MPDNQMTESEIMKRIEICASIGAMDRFIPRAAIPEVMGTPIDALSEAVLALLNRKNEQLAEKDAEIERLENLTIETATENACLYTQIKTAIAEAIKEFAERAKDVFTTIDGTFECWEVEEHIDEIAKEMGVEL